MVGGLRDIITCAKFQIEIFMGYDFTGGRIFDFPIDCSMGLTTVQRYCAACDSLYTQRNAPQTFFVRQKNIAKKVGNARACGIQRRAADVPQAVRTVLYGRG